MVMVIKMMAMVIGDDNDGDINFIDIDVDIRSYQKLCIN